MIRLKIISINPPENSLVVRYYTDLITEDMLCVQRSEEGAVLFCRTDVSITLPRPAPEGDALTAYLAKFAPQAWLETLEAMQQPDALAAISALSTQIGFEHTVGVESLDDKRLRVWAAIKAKRDDLRFEGGVLVSGHWFLSTQEATGEYTSLVLIASALGLTGSDVMRAAWRTMDEGVTVDMTPDLARSILVAGLSQRAAIDDAAQAHKSAMQAAPDPDAYDFSGGWPAVYGG